MTQFFYESLAQTGQTITGEIEAETPDRAADLLRQRGLVPLKINEQAQHISWFKQLDKRISQKKPNLADMTLFYRQAYTLIKSGIPIVRGFQLVAESAHNEILRHAIEEVVEELESGRDLSQAMSRHSIFPSLLVNMVRVGEQSGQLEQTFLRMHDHYEKEQVVLKQIKSAIRYPAMVIVAIIIAVFIMMIFVIPKFAGFYEANNLELPVPTRIILSTSEFVVNFWWLVFGVIGAGVFSFLRYIKTPEGRAWWDRVKLRFIVVGSIIERASLARYAYTLSLALSSGMPILQAITVTAKAIDNDYLEKAILGIRQNVEQGESLTRSMQKSKIFTPLVMQMVSIGEETGRLDNMLGEAAGFYEREVEYDVKSLNALIEPVLTAAIGGLVLILILGIFLPMWNIVDLIQ